MAIQNYASQYAKQVDERFSRESQAMMALNNDYKFTGVKTVNVYSIPVAPMNDYSRSGSSRYGTANDLGTNTQALTVSKDRAFTFVIDKGDKLQSMMVNDAGKALARQLREVCVPEFDSYVFKTLADNAAATNTTAATKANAYELFLTGMERLGNMLVPDTGRVCFCTYKFANLLKQDSSFMKYGDKSQEMLVKGIIGEVDGCRIVKVPASRLPAGCSFILTHARAGVGPKQLEDYKIHDNPPGISGWLVEGRMIYDCFVLDGKRDAIYYHGGQAELKPLNVQSSKSATANKSNILVITGAFDGAAQYYVTAATEAGLTAATAGTAITTSDWTSLSANPLEITITSGHKFIRVVDVDSANKPLAVGTAKLNIG